MLKIVHVGHEVHTTVSVDDKAWRKKYESATDATTEAVELGMIEAHTKSLVDRALLQRTWPLGGYEPPDQLMRSLLNPSDRLKSILTNSKREAFCCPDRHAGGYILLSFANTLSMSRYDRPWHTVSMIIGLARCDQD